MLQIADVTVQLGERVALQDIVLDVGAGELMGIVGPNGAGKTTLLRAVLGLVPLQSGRILVNGEPPSRNRSMVGYVPQRHEFAWDFPISVEGAVMTARTRLMGWLRGPSRVDREAVEQAMQRAGVEGLRRRPLGELSGGQRQRVLIARALALHPRVLLLDEPFTGIDIPTQETLTTLLVALRNEGNAVMMTTHDVPSAVRICSHLVLINRTVIGVGAPEELLSPDLWLQAFGVGTSRQLLASLSVSS